MPRQSRLKTIKNSPIVMEKALLITQKTLGPAGENGITELDHVRVATMMRLGQWREIIDELRVLGIHSDMLKLAELIRSGDYAAVAAFLREDHA